MICSMTGYAVKTRDIERGSLQLELKSVNSRYLDFHFRITEELRSLEMPLREMLSARLSRGKVECRLTFNAATRPWRAIATEYGFARVAEEFERPVRQEMPEAGPLSVNDVLRWPGMFGDQSVDFAALSPVILALAREAIDDFTATRGRKVKNWPP
jgi:uncharacterized protein (TIGR00255 family)